MPYIPLIQFIRLPYDDHSINLFSFFLIPNTLKVTVKTIRFKDFLFV